MKKSLITILFVGMAMSMQAVDLPKQGFGLQVGWAQPILRLNSPNNPSSAKDSLSYVVKMNGVKIGFVYDASFIAGFGSSIALNYTFGVYNGGWKSIYPNYGKYPQGRQLITYHEVELVVDWQYKFEIAKETYLMLYTGPSLQIGTSLAMRNDERIEDMMTGNIITTYGDKLDAYKVDPADMTLMNGYVKANNAIRRLNITWGVGAGFQYKRYFLRGGYDFGLMNPYRNTQFYNVAGDPMDIYTRGRFDQWTIKIGMYLWYEN